MGRTPCCSKVGQNRGPWKPEEDYLLENYIQKHGEGGWRKLPQKAGLERCGKSCRLRWMNYLRPDIKRGQILPDEEDLILRLHRLLGNRWSLIAGRIPGRTDNEIKNYWNSHLSKKLVSQGIDPQTHKALSKSELDNHDNNNIDPENKLSPQHKYPQTGDDIEAASEIAEYQHFPELVKVSELPETSVTDSLNQQYSCNAAQMNPTFLPYCNSTPELGLQDHDASLYLRRNSITNIDFVAPRMAHSDLQNISSFPGSICENPPFEWFPMNFESIEMQQRQMLPGNTHGITQGKDDNSDIFSYFLDSFIDEYQFHDQTNKHDESSLSENR